MGRRILLAALAAAALAVPSSAAAAPPLPFGHACTPQNGVLFCPTPDLASRVASWDGTPLDVDVTLPPTGDGPFPTIVLLHGFGQSKASFESASPEGAAGGVYHYNNTYFAQQGYAVVNYSARGFGALLRQGGSRHPRLRARLAAPRRPALRDPRHPVPAGTARRPEDRQARTPSA